MDNNKTFLGHPRGLATLFFTEMWERFTFYGMRALLVLFLVDAVARGGLGLDDKTATAIYGLYTAAVYVVALPGGWIADRLIGAQKAVLYGGILISLGSFGLWLSQTAQMFYLGLIVIILGVGLLKPNISALVADLYPEGGGRRDAGFTIFYMGINIGAFIGPLITAWLAQVYGWRVGFMAAGVGMAIGVLQFVMTRHYLGGAGARPHTAAGADSSLAWRSLWFGAAITAVLVALPFFGVVQMSPVQLSDYGIVVIIGMAVFFFIYLLFLAGLDAIERKRVLVLIVLFIACALFWSGFEQAGSSLNLFAERYTDRVIGALTVPAGWFQSLNAIFIVVFAPVFSAMWVSLARRNLDPSTPVKFALGLVGMALGFLAMFVAARIVVDGLPAAAYWLVLTYLLHTFGELCLSPVGLSSVTKLVPQRFVGQSLGIWFLASSLGNLIAGRIAGEFDAENVSAMPGQYLDIFWFGMIAALILLIISPVVRRWIGGVS
ncbi:MAG: peptide MFS transporter [Gammaproteobacteria bacterium]|nr:peptide MFS transporter [Gammaproteobacteria bacterium]